MRITAQLTKKYPLSRRAAKEALGSGLVMLNGSPVRKDLDVSENELIEYTGVLSHPEFDMNEYLLMKNNDVCFIYKPPFMHSDRHRPEDSLTVSDIMEELPGYTSLSRLDYGTDGVIGSVRSDHYVNNLEKRYLAIVCGKFPSTLDVSWPINADNCRKVTVLEGTEGNFTKFKSLRFNGKYSLIEAVFKKAARHQVRSFCAKAGFPILGDDIYGGENFTRLCLHCERVTINEYFASSGIFADKFAAIID